MSTDFSTDKRQSGLTERRIRDAKPGPKTILLRDREVVGLAVRIARGARKPMCSTIAPTAGAVSRPWRGARKSP